MSVWRKNKITNYQMPTYLSEEKTKSKAMRSFHQMRIVCLKQRKITRRCQKHLEVFQWIEPRKIDFQPLKSIVIKFCTPLLDIRRIVWRANLLFMRVQFVPPWKVFLTIFTRKWFSPMHSRLVSCQVFALGEMRPTFRAWYNYFVFFYLKNTRLL